MAEGLSTWRWSWRALGAWLAASIGAGALYALVAAALDVWVSPEEAGAFAHDALQLAVILIIVLAVLSALLFLLVALLARLMPWRRPLVESLLGAAMVFGLTHYEGTLTLSIDAGERTLAPGDHPAAFILAHILPPIIGALLVMFYWLLAGKPR